MNVSSTVQSLAKRIRGDQPDLVITDFEPLLPHAAEQCVIPYVSFDHQHFLTAYDLSALPRSLRWWAAAMTLAVRAHYTQQQATIVTSFFQLPLNPGHEKTISVGPIVRSAIRQTRPIRGDYLISYLRSHTPDRVLSELEHAPCEVRVYGLGERPSRGNLRFHPFDQQQFIDDLAGCMAVVGAAGKQTLGEALQLGKPVLALPEDNHFEQRINAFYLQHNGCGRSIRLSEFQRSDLIDFIDSLDEFIPHVNEMPRDGNEMATAAILNQLQAPMPVSMVA